VLKVMARTERRWGGRDVEKVDAPRAPTGAPDVSSCRRIRPMDAHRESARFGLKMSSGPEDFHLRALPEPYVNLSIHTAPVVRPFP
jgi:hypothetical protein